VTPEPDVGAGSANVGCMQKKKKLCELCVLGGRKFRV